MVFYVSTKGLLLPVLALLCLAFTSSDSDTLRGRRKCTSGLRTGIIEGFIKLPRHSNSHQSSYCVWIQKGCPVFFFCFFYCICWMPVSYCCTLTLPWEEVAINFVFCSLLSCRRQQQIVRRGVSHKGLFARNKFCVTKCLFSPTYSFLQHLQKNCLQCSAQH